MQIQTHPTVSTSCSTAGSFFATAAMLPVYSSARATRAWICTEGISTSRITLSNARRCPTRRCHGAADEFEISLSRGAWTTGSLSPS